MDGPVEVCPVRDDQARDGLRVRLVGDAELGSSFEAFYDGLPDGPVFRILDRDAGWVVFAEGADHAEDPRRFGIEAIDALERVSGALPGLTVDEIRVGSHGGLLLQPRFRTRDTTTPHEALAAFLREQSPPGEDPRVDAAVDALLDPAPEVRRTARALLVGSRPAAALTRTGELKLTTVADTRPPGGALDVAPPRAAVVIPPDALRELDPRGRSAAAGLAGVPLSVLDGLAAGGLPLVIEAHRRARDARTAADRIRRETGLPVEAATGGSLVLAAWTLALATTGAATAFAAFTLSLVGIWIVPLMGFLLAAGLFALSMWTGWGWYSQRRLLSDARESRREAHEERNRRLANPRLARAFTALSDARRALAAAGLPAAPASDLRAVLKAAEAEIEALVKADSAVRSPSTTTSAELRSRLDEVRGDDSASAARRERLERNLAEVESLEARRRYVADEAASIEAVLAEVTAALGHWETDVGDEAALDSVLKAARRVSARRTE